MKGIFSFLLFRGVFLLTMVFFYVSLPSVVMAQNDGCVLYGEDFGYYKDSKTYVDGTGKEHKNVISVDGSVDLVGSKAKVPQHVFRKESNQSVQEGTYAVVDWEDITRVLWNKPNMLKDHTNGSENGCFLAVEVKPNKAGPVCEIKLDDLPSGESLSVECFVSNITYHSNSPIVSLRVLDSKGSVLKTTAQTVLLGGSKWYSLLIEDLVLKGTEGPVTVQIYDFYDKGSSGNDLAIDDITVKRKAPASFDYEFYKDGKKTSSRFACPGEKWTLKVPTNEELKKYYNNKHRYIFQYSEDAGNTWKNFTDIQSSASADMNLSLFGSDVDIRVLAGPESSLKQIKSNPNASASAGGACAAYIASDVYSIVVGNVIGLKLDTVLSCGVTEVVATTTPNGANVSWMLDGSKYSSTEKRLTFKLGDKLGKLTAVANANWSCESPIRSVDLKVKDKNPTLDDLVFYKDGERSNNPFLCPKEEWKIVLPKSDAVDKYYNKKQVCLFQYSEDEGASWKNLTDIQSAATAVLDPTLFDQGSFVVFRALVGLEAELIPFLKDSKRGISENDLCRGFSVSNGKPVEIGVVPELELYPFEICGETSVSSIVKPSNLDVNWSLDGDPLSSTDEPPFFRSGDKMGRLSAWVSAKGVCPSDVKSIDLRMREKPSSELLSTVPDFCAYVGGVPSESPEASDVPTLPSAKEGEVQWFATEEGQGTVVTDLTELPGKTDAYVYYYKVLNADGCYSEVSSITFHAKPTLVVGIDTLMACGETTLTAVATAEDNRDVAFEWTPSVSGVEVRLTEPSTYALSGIAEDHCSSKRIEQAVEVKKKPSSELLSTVPDFCAYVGGVPSESPEASDVPTLPSAKEGEVQWFATAAGQGTVVTDLAELPGKTDAYVYYYNVLNADGCYSEVSSITFHAKPTLVVGIDTLMACGETTLTAVATAEGNRDVAFEWTPANEELQFVVKEEAFYELSGSADEHCSSKPVEMDVEIRSFPKIESVDSIDAKSYRIVIASGEGALGYMFRVDNAEFDDNDTKHDLSFMKHTAYVMNSYGCSDTMTFDVPAPAIIFPNFFTPDGDGVNDQWVPHYLADVSPTAIISIFDRTGKLLVEYKAGDASDWDGTYQGNPMPSTDYWYEVDIDELDKLYVGHFTLLRAK